MGPSAWVLGQLFQKAMLQSTLALLAENSFDWSRGSMFLICAIVGGSVITLQTLLLLFGFGGVDDFDGLADGDMELDGTESAFGFLSVRAVSAFLCTSCCTAPLCLPCNRLEGLTALARTPLGLVLLHLPGLLPF